MIKEIKNKVKNKAKNGLIKELLPSNDFDIITKLGVTLVDFWAPWCHICRSGTSVISELASEYELRAKVCKVNTDENQDLVVKLGIRSIPTMMIFKDGDLVDTLIGVKTKAEFEKAINQHL